VSYNLQMTTDSGDIIENWIWSDILGGASQPANLLTAYKLTSSIVGGVSYKFRVRASNEIGNGPYSNIITIKAAQIPA
jgi:hypothetical protein